jgi:hypothetical protein
MPMRHRLLFLIFTCTILSSLAAASGEIPILRSGSKSITIIDGDHIKTNYWWVMPERHPDYYYVEIPMKPHSVTFQSDIDSITFPVEFGEEHDFVVQLNDGVSCPTRIRATYRKLQPYSHTEPKPVGTADTIPFRIGDNDKIFIKGRLNGGEMLDFQFDLGAGGAVIKQDSVPKVNMQFDGTATLHNSDGSNVVPSSSSNQLQIENLSWEGLPFVAGNNMTHREDGLLGNFLFQDKVIEIDYDRNVITIHDSLPVMKAGYSKHRIILDGVVPFIDASLTIGNEQREGWFMFDTGARTTQLFSLESSPASKLWAELRKVLRINHATTSGPRLTIGGYAFTNFNYRIKQRDDGGGQLGLLGNDLLKRFNVILDNQNGFIYLKPNSLTGGPFRNPEYYLARVLIIGGGALLVLAAGCGWMLYRRRSKHRMTKRSNLTRESTDR